MNRKTIVFSVNACWNLLNFRKPLMLALQDRGHRVVALAPEDGHATGLAALDIPFVPLPIDNAGLSPVADLALLARYRAALRRLKPDLLLGYTIKPNVYGSIAAHSLGIPVINTISGLGTAFMRPGPLAVVATGLYRLALRGSSRVFFQNDEDRALFLAKKIVRPGQTGLAPGSGIDLDRFRPKEAPAGRPFTFLFLGRLLWDKGIGEYVEAARRVRASRPEARFRLLGFAGAANRTAVGRGDIDTWVAEGLVDYLGAADDVRPHVAAADCIVLPSYREGLPRALLEGAAMGRPLIAADAPGCRDVVSHGVNGLLCAVRDPQALAEAMLAMLAMPEEERRRMGAAGRSMVEARFDQKIVVDLYMRAIEAALARSPR